jgi:predicted DsbA family dithiol-disulfide isomerase
MLVPVPPRTYPAAEPVSLVLYEDPLSPWCLVVDRRLRAVLRAVEAPFTLRHEPFPLHAEPRALTKTARQQLVRSARRAAREPEASGLVPDLWLSDDPPLSSVPVLAAFGAARLQGAASEDALRQAVREAALFRGLNVSRHDVLYELAERAGLDLARFAGALAAPATERRVRACHEEAVGRGVELAPALVVGDEWLVTGPRAADEYREILERYAEVRFGLPLERILH